jgi:hypothetical protein
MGFSIHILSGRNRSTNLAGDAALAASFNPHLDSSQKQPALTLKDGNTRDRVVAHPQTVLNLDALDDISAGSTR